MNMTPHWLIHNRRAQATQVTTGEWIDLACMLSCYVLVIGFMAAFKWDAPWLYVASLIPALLSTAAAHFHDWSYEV